MDISEEDFERQYRETLDSLIENLAEHPEVNLKDFYHMTCFLENLSFFGPVIYGLIQKAKQ